MFRKIAALGVAGVLMIGAAAPALADTTAQVQTTVTVVEPALSIQLQAAPLSFGTDRTSDAEYGSDGLQVIVTDSATDGQTTTGWNVTAQATALSGPTPIAASNVRFYKGGNVTITDTGGAQTQNNSPVINSSLSTFEDLSAATKIFAAAAANQSKGEFTLTWDGGASSAFRLYIPGTTSAGTYTGNLTMTISRGL